MPGMQSDAIAQSGTRPLPSAFDRLTKDHALKILQDYSASTRRKWQSIRKEILSYSSVKASKRASLLSRQDLENWARGDSVIGDAKFARVYEFLTHPDTLARPEFARAAALLEPRHHLFRIGRALAEFYSDFDSAIGKARIFEPPLSREEIEACADLMSGIYTGTHGSDQICLVLERIPTERFYVAHYLVSATGFRGASADWNLDRHSGFATVGSAITVHLKGVVVSHTRTLSVLPPRDWSSFDTLEVIADDVMSNSLKTVMWRDMKQVKKRLPYLNPLDYNFRVTKDDSVYLREIVDEIRWRVPV